MKCLIMEDTNVLVILNVLVLDSIDTKLHPNEYKQNELNRKQKKDKICHIFIEHVYHMKNRDPTHNFVIPLS